MAALTVALLYVAASILLFAAVIVFGVLVLDMTTVTEFPAGKEEMKAIVSTFVADVTVVPVAVQVVLQVNPVNVITSLPPLGTVT